ncbi:MAG TPA: energy transducer TonB [Terriglobales bacterium]|jgi:protein TonB
MFAEILSDSPWDNRPHRRMTTLVSFALQGAGLGLLLLIPLLSTQGLPQLEFATPLTVPVSLPLAPTTLAQPRVTSNSSNVTPDGTVIVIRSIPRSIEMVTDAAEPPQIGIGTVGVVGGTGDHWSDNGVLRSIAGGSGAVPSLPPPTVTPPRRVSRIMEGNLIHRVQPDYPAIARSARVQGEVILAAVISKDGAIENLRVVRGHPLLVKAALTAVQQWRYRPYVLNGEPIEVETQVTVNFVLAGGGL